MTGFKDIRYAVRTLLKRPGFAVVAVVTLALGIGANTAIFSVVNGVLLLPSNFHSWEEQNRVFETIGASRGTNMNLTGGDQPERLSGQMVLVDFFGALGRMPVLGRVSRGDETRRGAERLVVISHGLWKRRFGNDAGILGQTLLLDGLPFTVIGVLPEDFMYPTPETEIYVPIGVFAESLPWDVRGDSPGIYALARMKAGVGIDHEPFLLLQLELVDSTPFRTGANRARLST